MDASEDSVWHFDPLLWQNGGAILNEDNTQAAFNSPEGVEALDVLRGMAVDDGSVYLDIQNSNYTDLFNSGRIAMLMTGPWDLSSFPDVNYGVTYLPGFNGDHQTIAGPDMWTVFDNGNGRADAALRFIEWLTAPEQMVTDALATGHLPFRTLRGGGPGVPRRLRGRVPGGRCLRCEPHERGASAAGVGSVSVGERGDGSGRRVRAAR